MDAHDHPLVNVIVDVQASNLRWLSDEAAPGLPPENAPRKTYIAQIKNHVRALRELGVPTFWITQGGRSKFYPRLEPWPAAACLVREIPPIKQLGLAELDPRTDEDILNKHTFDAFQARPDIAAVPFLRDYLLAQGTKMITLAGMFSGVCVLETAMGAVLNGFQCSVMTDLIVSRNGDDRQRLPEWYVQEMEVERRRLMDWPSRHYSDRDAEILQQIDFSTSAAFLQTLAEPPAPPKPGIADGFVRWKTRRRAAATFC